MNHFWRGLAVAAANARNTSTRRAARTRELTAGPAETRTRDAALPTRTTAGAAVLPAGTAVAVGVTATATWILLEDAVGGSCRDWGAYGGFSRGDGHHGNRCRGSSTDNQRFHEIEFLEHGHRRRYTPIHRRSKHRISVVMVDDVDDVSVGGPDENPVADPRLR